MGLDMSLTAERFMSQYMTDDPDGEAARIERISKEFDELGADDFKICTVVAEVGYWRKANAIHDWFVRNVQDGVDECQKSYVSDEQLQKLLDDVNTVLENPDRAMELLPPKAGFFFGDVAVDEYYFNHLRDTKKILEAVLVEGRFDHMWDFYYQSSW